MKIKYAIVLEVQPTNGSDPDKVIAALPQFLADALYVGVEAEPSEPFTITDLQLNGWIKQP